MIVVTAKAIAKRTKLYQNDDSASIRRDLRKYEGRYHRYRRPPGISPGSFADVDESQRQRNREPRAVTIITEIQSQSKIGWRKVGTGLD
jgi:hypothetical protein